MKERAALPHHHGRRRRYASLTAALALTGAAAGTPVTGVPAVT
ncbi:hypothetical protein [Streptomyces sp. NPDC048473]